MSVFTRTISWFRKAGQIPETPVFIPRQVAFYTGMQCEELAEKLFVIGAPTAALALALDALGNKLKAGEFDAAFTNLSDAQRLALLDGDLDKIWVTIGSLAAQGVDADGAFNEVARANWDKFPGGVVTRDAATGKVVKPAGWRAPELQKFLIGSAK